MQDFHLPVLRREVVHCLNLKKGDIVFDGTLGGAGHTIEIIKAIAPTGKVIAVDLDSQALSTAASKLKSLDFLEYADIVNDNYANIAGILEKLGIKQINGLLLDLGISSFQIDLSERGFSYLKDQNLDMRFSDNDRLDAYSVVNNYPEEDLRDIFYKFGEESWAPVIAKKIVSSRRQGPIKTTGQLVEIIKSSIPAKLRHKGHPAKRVFQAIRIEVNSELENLKRALADGFGLLSAGGRLAVISYHSLEDRIVKRTFEKLSGKCTCPPEFPVCRCGAIKEGNIITKKAVVPSEEEINTNPRSKSAKLRVFEKNK
jgi:16S rRNA (cytosine1402-N4)-methyltransferase